MTKNFLSHLLSSSEMVRRTRDFDWSKTSLGSPDTWPQFLRTTVCLVLESGIPMSVFCGEHFTPIFNDAYKALLDSKVISDLSSESLTIAWNKIIETGESYTKDSLSFSALRDDQGRLHGLLLIVKDSGLKEQYKELSGKFESVFYETHAGMALLRGPQFIFEKVNQKFIEVMGRDDLLDKPLLKVLPELEEQSFFELMKGVFYTGTAFTGSEMLVSVNAKNMYLDFSCARIDNGDGKPYGIYIHAVDNTEKVSSRKNIEEALKARDEFISIASHELKTPLTSLKLQSQIQRRLIQKNDPRALEAERIKQFSESTDTQISRLNRLVDDMLDISRIRSGKLTINPDIVDLSKIILNVIDDMRTHFTTNNFPSMNVSQEIIGTWDSLRIEQVISNLLTNAIRYGLDKPITIDAKKQNGLAILKVQDMGIGIAPEHHSKIFNRFERINAKEVSGLGLGLFLTKQIIEAHNGEIFVESELGKGSVFTVQLPVNQVFSPNTLPLRR